MILQQAELIGKSDIMGFRNRILSRSGEIGKSVPGIYWNPFVHGLASDRKCEHGHVDVDGKFVWRP
ncbi:hypothetical protein RISK_005452 [Rhodopirellula islandica]|uniref:Uncharacterized protein n=1 Tax=Rhodopirellula islandica TaxID=595434 RepID=A0A0J1B7F7_RHOIS|nr:hypothetical protein RISK_005452 [Rhodopirellula islandica]